MHKRHFIMAPWVPPYDEWAKEAELTFWFGKWRDPKSALGFDFLYKDVAKRQEYEKRDDWTDQEYPVDYSSAWAKGRQKWEVWLDAYDSWDHETKRLCEVYTRIAEPLDLEEANALWEGKFPKAPPMPDVTFQLFQAARSGDIEKLAEVLEHEDACVNCKDQTLQTPLMAAALSGSLECVEYLVDLGADVTCEDSEQDTAADLAVAGFGERHGSQHPVIMFFKTMDAPRGHGVRSHMLRHLTNK